MVLTERRNSHTRTVAEEIVGVEGGVPQKLIAYAVELVRARLGLDLYIGAAGTAKFRGVVVVGYFKFLNGIHRRVYRQDAEESFVVSDSVNLPVVRIRLNSIHIRVGNSLGIVRINVSAETAGIRHRPRIQADKLGKVSHIQRQTDHLLGIDNLGLLGAFGFHQSSFAGNFDAVRDCP